MHGEMSILMMDNSSIHHVQEVKCNAWGFLTGYRNMDTQYCDLMHKCIVVQGKAQKSLETQKPWMQVTKNALWQSDDGRKVFFT